MAFEIRHEEPTAQDAVYRVNELAFSRTEEARLVEALRGVALPQISMVAVQDADIVGHVFFSPVEIESCEVRYALVVKPRSN